MRTRMFILAMAGFLMAAAQLFADDFNPVLGKVGDFSIREADLDRLLASQSPDIQKQFQQDPQQKVNLVRELLIKKAVVARAKKDGFDKKPDVREQLSLLTDNFISQEYLVKVVLAGVTVSEEDAKKYYKDHENEYIIPDQVKVRHILFDVTTETPPEKREKARTAAEAVLQRLKKGEEFTALAKEFSEDQNSSQKGGELGIITRGKTNSEEFEKAAFALKAGELSGIVTTAYGLHIIRVDERHEKRTALYDEVKDFILKKVKQEQEQKAAQEFTEKVAKESGLEVFSDAITGSKANTPPVVETGKKDTPK